MNQLWSDLGPNGLAWGVTETLEPGDVITLTVGDQYYNAQWSNMSWPLAAGTSVYAQADSARTDTGYGAVLEIHEIIGGAYGNNIGSTVSTSAP